MLINAMILRVVFASFFLTPASPFASLTVPLIAPHTFEIAGEMLPGHEPDGNTYILESTKGLTVIDTGRHESTVERSRCSRRRNMLRLWR